MSVKMQDVIKIRVPAQFFPERIKGRGPENPDMGRKPIFFHQLHQKAGNGAVLDIIFQGPCRDKENVHPVFGKLFRKRNRIQAPVQFPLDPAEMRKRLGPGIFQGFPLPGENPGIVC